MTRKLLLFVRSLFLKTFNSSEERSFTPSLRLICLGMFFVVSYINAATITSTANGGNWNNNATWVGGVQPAPGDNVIIATTGTNVVDTNGSRICAGITITGRLQMSTGDVLTVNGNVSGTGRWITGGGVMTISLTGNWSFNGTSSGSGATVIFNGTGNQTLTGNISSSDIGTLVVNKTSGSVIMGNLIKIATFTNTAGIFDASTYLLTVSGTTTLTAGTLRAGALTWGGNYSFTQNPPVGFTIDYYNATPTINGAITYQNLIFSGTGTTANPSADIIIQGNLVNASSGILNFSARNITINGTATQSIAGFSTTGNVSVTKTGGMATLASAVTAGNLSVASGPYLNLGTTSLIHSVNGTLTLGATTASSGSWGGTTSGATNINSTYFASALGKINVSCLNFTKVVPITSVILNTLNKTTSSPSTIAYEDFTSDTPTKLIAGQSYYLSVKGNTDDGSGSNLDVNYYYTAYFDWNNNGTFDTGENYTVGTIRNSTGSDGKVASVYITIPVATAAANIKMRVLGRLGGYSSSSCVTSSTGQGEDYTVTIDAPCSGNLNPGNTLTSATSVCPSAPFNLSLQNTITDGATYSWETSPDNTGSSVWTSAVPAPTNFFGLEQFNGTNPDANIYGVATITGGQLVLTTTTNSTYGAYVIQKTPGSNINAFTVNFDYQIPAGGGGADGFSLSYANDVQNDNAGGESGSGSGIIVQFDTYDNEGVTAGSRVRVLYAGYTLYNSAIDAPSLRPTTGNTPVVLKVDANGKLTLIINNATVVSNLALPAAYLSAVKSSWRFKFAARTGGSNDKHIIDNLLIRYLDVTASGPTYTTSQTAKTYYRVKITCGSSTFYSNPVLVDMTSSTITNMTASSCHNVAFTVTPVDGTNGTVKSGTTYSWPIPTMASGITGGAASSGSPTSITGTLQNSTAGALTAIYTVTPTTAGCVGPTFTLTITVNKTATTPTLGTITQPTCTTSTGSIALSGLPASGTLLQDNGTVVTNITITGPTMTISGLSPATYKFAANNGCVSAYTSSVTIGAANIWNGTTWSYGADPTINDAVDFRGNFTLDQDVNACSCTVSNSANVVIKSKRTLTVTNGVFVVSGTLTFEDSANLMQTTTSNSLNT
ncbi:hypothetical protein IR010_19910, partial [Flavobacterium sp. MR2016-29]|uniref:beta strand repeat-containing protein n=1 Tax=Flavobacterium sp. MR2016-29 TaxID=2783795 RepID=UPI0019E6F6E3